MRKLIFENFGLKVSAVLISVLLWLFVTSRGQSEMSFQIPIEFKDIPIGLGIAGSSAKAVNVTVRGQERVMKSLRPSDVRVFVDLGKARKGETGFHISKDDVKLPFAMSVTNIDPPTVRVKIDETVTKTVPVRPSIAGAPEEGFYIKAVEVEPKSVVVQGLTAEVRRISEVRTEVMDVSGLSKTATQDLEIDTAGSNIKPETSRIRVTVIIAGRKR